MFDGSGAWSSCPHRSCNEWVAAERVLFGAWHTHMHTHAHALQTAVAVNTRTRTGCWRCPIAHHPALTVHMPSRPPPLTTAPPPPHDPPPAGPPLQEDGQRACGRGPALHHPRLLHGAGGGAQPLLRLRLRVRGRRAVGSRHGRGGAGRRQGGVLQGWSRALGQSEGGWARRLAGLGRGGGGGAGG